MIAVVPGQDVTSPWRLVSRTAAGADVLAIAHAGPDLPGHAALRRLAAGDGTASVVRMDNARFRWALTDPDGLVIAESPAVYRRPEACRQAFTDAQRAARTAFGGVATRLPPDRGSRATSRSAAADISISHGSRS